MAEWLKLCDASVVPDHEGRCVHLNGEDIAVFNLGGDFFAVADRCPHGQASLAEGWVENGEVECPLHQSRFNLATGEVQCPPARDNVRAYKVRLEGGVVMVSLGEGA